MKRIMIICSLLFFTQSNYSMLSSGRLKIGRRLAAKPSVQQSPRPKNKTPKSGQSAYERLYPSHLTPLPFPERTSTLASTGQKTQPYKD